MYYLARYFGKLNGKGSEQFVLTKVTIQLQQQTNCGPTHCYQYSAKSMKDYSSLVDDCSEDLFFSFFLSMLNILTRIEAIIFNAVKSPPINERIVVIINAIFPLAL